MANDIIIARNLLIPRLTSLKEINYSFFLMIFDDIFELDFPELLSIEPKNRSLEIKLMARLLTFISNDLFSISFDHIKAEDIVDGNINSVHDLLEIISTFIHYIPDKFSKVEDVPIGALLSTKSVQTGFSSDEESIENFSQRFSPKISRNLDYLSSKSSSSSESSSSESTHIQLRTRFKDIVEPKKLMNLSVESSISSKTPIKEPTLESKAIQTEFEPEPKPQSDVSPKIASLEDVTLDEYKRLKYENFATVLGNRLHETLKLKEMTDNLELRIKKYYGDVTAKTPQRKARTVRRQSPRNKTPLKSKSTNRKVSPSKTPKSFSLDHLLKTFPEIPRNTIKSLKEEENRQKKVIENLNKEISINQMKVKSKLKEAIDRQEKKSNIIGSEVKQMQTLVAMKGVKAAKIKENSAKRDSRIERARIQKMVDKFQNELNSKYKRLQSLEERIVVNEFEKRQKQQNDCINEFRKRIKEKHSKEMERQERILDSIDTL